MCRSWQWWYTVAAFVVTGLLIMAAVPAPGLALEDDDCTSCHCDPSIIEDSGCRFYINPDIFSATTHADVGCTACHDSVSDDHPDDGLRPTHVDCSQCHEDVDAEYQQSVHRKYAGCTSCHNPHEVRNPMAVSGVDENRPCAKCHNPIATVARHSDWLPRATLHMESLPCIACHTGSKDYVITLFVQYVGKQTAKKTKAANAKVGPDKKAKAGTSGKGVPVSVRLATYEELTSMTGVDDIQKLLDTNADGFVSLRELKRFSRLMGTKGFRLWGMLMPEEVTHSYQILDNRWDCSFCHATGPNAMQKSYVALPNKDGTFKREPVERGAILEALFGTPNFYMLGASRNRNLTILGLLIVAGGAMVPVVHGTFRFLTRHNRRSGHDD